MTTLTKKQAKTVAQVVARLDPPPIGAQIDQIWALREDKRALEAKVKEVEADITTREDLLMQALQGQETDKASGKKASASISTSTVSNVKDWDSFMAFVSKNKMFHLVQRRVSEAAVREIYESGKDVPGLEPFTKRKINIRTL